MGLSRRKAYIMCRGEDFRSKDFEVQKRREEIFVIDLIANRRDMPENRKKIEHMIEQAPNKVYIILEDQFPEGEVNAMLNEHVSWAMKIECISTQEKERYVRNFMKANQLECKQETVKKLADNSFYRVKNQLINILVDCKMKQETEVENVLGEVINVTEDMRKNKKGMQELEELIGLEEVKEQIKKVVNYIKLSKNRKNMPMLHMCFNGNPGTGKTTVARIVGKIFNEEQILSAKPNFVEAQRGDLIGKYVGQTAPLTQEVINRALGGILFIDEAYAISSYIQDEAGRDYGAECIATLLKGMEDHRDNLCVILAGYTKEMKQMLRANPGFESRIQFTIDFPDYSAEELYAIFQQLCQKEDYRLARGVKAILLQHFEQARKEENFSNARYVRSLFEKVKMEQANRVMTNENCNENRIQKGDVEKITNQKKQEIPQKIIGFAC